MRLNWALTMRIKTISKNKSIKTILRKTKRASIPTSTDSLTTETIRRLVILNMTLKKNSDRIYMKTIGRGQG